MAKVRILSGSEPATLIEKNITANGTYNASSDDADGYSSVNVNVNPILITKSVTANGTYTAHDEPGTPDGYSSVTVNVPSHNVLIENRTPLTSEGNDGDTFIKYTTNGIITLAMSINGGYNGGAQLNCNVDGNDIINAIGTSPYNLDYDVKTGSINYFGHTISVVVTPPANSTSRLTITWSMDGDTVWTESILYEGANTSYGYGSQSENMPIPITSQPAIDQIYYKQSGNWITYGDLIIIN